MMQRRLMRYDVKRWADEFIDRLLQTKKYQEQMEMKVLTPQAQNELVNDYLKSSRRLILLDYDGTLVPFYGRPTKARPSDEVIMLLEELAENPKNEVVLISGRERYTIDDWFHSLDIGLVAEHGAWTRDRNAGWEQMTTLTNEWKDEVRPILELYVDRSPGSFVEEKEFSLAWHYRRCWPALGEVRARELVNDLLHLTTNLNLQVLEGSKVVEIKNAGVNKGQAALKWVSKKDWDFILALGDDLTDEDVFQALPATTWSIKVGFGASAARYNIGFPINVRSLLKEMNGF
jgi:trehalose 6-phosphate synthase/phosphatase